MAVNWVESSCFNGVSIFFSWAMTALVGRPLEIAVISSYSLIAWSIGISPAIAESASSETVL